MSDRAIRVFTNDDLDDVVGVWHRSGLAAYTYLPLWQALTLDKASEVFSDAILGRSDIWVGTKDDCIVAFLAMSRSYIDRMYVDPEYQRQGWGDALMEHAKSLRPDGLELHTHQENHVARAFYERHGFELIALGTSPPPESAPDAEYHWRPE